MSHRSRPFVSSRRQFLTLLGSVGASSLMPAGLALGAAAPLFEEVPSSVSGIAWTPPSGRVERLIDVPIDRCVTIVEGQGRIKA